MLKFGDAVDDVQIVTFEDQVIGRVVKPANGFYSWEPADPMPFGLNIAASVAFDMCMIVDFLEHMIPKQLEAIKAKKKPDTDTLHPALRPYRVPGPLGKALKHPLHFDVMHHPIRNAEINYIYKIRKKDADEHLAAKRWREYVWHHERPYRVEAFFEIGHRLPHSSYWQTLSALWRDSENISQTQELWRMLLDSNRPMRDQIMDASERRKLAAMPETITIYRGANARPAIRGMSWTIDRDKGVWFANRYKSIGTGPLLATAKVRKDKVIAYFTRRDENEIVILPENCGKITTEVPPP